MSTYSSAKRMRNLRAERKSKGLCCSCGKVPVTDRYECNDCTDKTRARQAEFRARTGRYK